MPGTSCTNVASQGLSDLLCTGGLIREHSEKVGCVAQARVPSASPVSVAIVIVTMELRVRVTDRWRAAPDLSPPSPSSGKCQGFKEQGEPLKGRAPGAEA